MVQSVTAQKSNEYICCLFNDAASSSEYKASNSKMMRRIGFWDYGFETRLGRGCSSLVFVVCGAGSGFCDELIIRPEELLRVCVCVSDIRQKPQQRTGLMSA
jgi:hypothetical protein